MSTQPAIKCLSGGATHFGPPAFHAVNPANAQTLPLPFAEASSGDITQAATLATAAFDTFRDTTLAERALFLEAIASHILNIGDTLITTAMAETALPRPRLEGERGRTVGQLRLFAHFVRAGAWLDARIDPAQPDRTPIPRSDLRMRQIAIGPVAVFGASNFPLAFSVAGGDTASALAAGCPVIVKAHPAHPGTSLLVGQAIQAAVAACGLPSGVFAMVFGTSHALGSALVCSPAIKAVGFTGSRQGGLALAQAAASRAEPIPVYAEMSSINPVLLLPAALAARTQKLAEGFIGSLNLGAGQFCTNPGLLLAIESPALEQFIAATGTVMASTQASPMLTSGIFTAYTNGVTSLAAQPGVHQAGQGGAGEEPNRCQPAFFTVDAARFLTNPNLSHEVFGASSLLVKCPSPQVLLEVLESLEGQLTATLHMDEADHPLAATLLPVLERKAGRILANGWPTGVEVCHAMVHGGPYPATSDSRTTSVGTLAIRRFLRPVCYQDLPAALLPAVLQDHNPCQLPRLLDGQLHLASRPEIA